MSKIRRYLEKKAVENVPGPALDAAGKAVLKAVDLAVVRRWDDALEIAAEAEGDTAEAKTSSIISRFKKELTLVGAATGAVAAAPVVGTAAAAGALAADLAWFAMRATDLIMAIGAAHGHTEATEEERRAWVLAVLAFGEESAQKFKSLLGDVEGGTDAADGLSQRAAGVVGGDALTLDALRRINTDLAGQLVAKYGARRSALAIGRLLPFGVGAVVGGTANYGFIRMVGGHAKRFFDEAGFLPSADGPFMKRPRHLSSVPRDDGDTA